ncbi:hypothetical protein ACQU0X_29600 [Pseudovibrio ascidiaceicola]|uniref:hypothetical protein n=1 Tax=Pseudovibrio ascidiaceicola TaxID=285279 RepID=UPI003D366282
MLQPQFRAISPLGSEQRGFSLAVIPDKQCADPGSSVVYAGVGGGGSGSCIALCLWGMTVVGVVSVSLGQHLLIILQLFVDRGTVPFHIHM